MQKSLYLAGFVLLSNALASPLIGRTQDLVKTSFCKKYKCAYSIDMGPGEVLYGLKFEKNSDPDLEYDSPIMIYKSQSNGLIYKTSMGQSISFGSATYFKNALQRFNGTPQALVDDWVYAFLGTKLPTGFRNLCLKSALKRIADGDTSDMMLKAQLSGNTRHSTAYCTAHFYEADTLAITLVLEPK